MRDKSLQQKMENISLKSDSPEIIKSHDISVMPDNNKCISTMSNAELISAYHDAMSERQHERLHEYLTVMIARGLTDLTKMMSGIADETNRIIR